MTGATHGTAAAAAGGRLRVVVIGAGIVGACCAAYLRLEGHEVTLLEAEAPAAGASAGNAGAISPGSCIPLSMPGTLRKAPSWVLRKDGPLVVRPGYALTALPWLLRFVAAGRADRVDGIADALRALHGPVHECYRPILAAAQAQALLRRSGCLVVYRSAAAFASARGEWEMRRRRGIDWEKVEGPRLRELVPALAPDFACGVLQPDHGYVVDPRGLVRRLVAQMRSDGADLVQGRARDIGSSSDRLDIVLDDGRKLAADRVVLAAGAWSRPLAAKLGAAIPLETQRGYHLHLRAPRIDLPLPVSFAEGKFYATPMSDGLRLAGTVEFAGLRAAPDYRRAHRLAEMAGRWLPGLGLDGASEWMGHRPCLPDSLPVIGPSPRDPRVLLAFGHGHNGMTSAPATGRLVADMVAGRRPFIDPSPYRPDRF